MFIKLIAELMTIKLFILLIVLNPLAARISTVFGYSLLEDRLFHKGAWVAALLGIGRAARKF